MVNQCNLGKNCTLVHVVNYMPDISLTIADDKLIVSHSFTDYVSSTDE